MSKRRGGSLPRVMPRRAPSGLDIRMVIPGLPIAAPDPLGVSLGGSETAGLQLAAELVRQGHRVTVACNTPAPFVWRGVRLQGGFGDAELAESCDLFLVQRDAGLLRYRRVARVAFLWLHDHEGSLGSGEADRYLFVSEWQAAQFRAQASSAADRFAVIRNGIDLDLIADATAGVERDPYRIIYTSLPERGLEVLLRGVLPMILEHEPRASLHIAGYDHPGGRLAEYHRILRGLAEPFGDRVVWHEPLSKRELYRLMAAGGLYLYPTPAPVEPEFAETSCITAMEAMACGLPWISTDRGALPETVGDAGVLVPLGDAPDATEPAVIGRLAEAALAIMTERDRAEDMRQAGLARAAGLGWGPVAEQIVAEARIVVATPRSVARGAPEPSVLILTPTYDGRLLVQYVDALMDTRHLLREHGIACDARWMSGCSTLPVARNRLAAIFLAKSEFTHALWIDADIQWRPQDVLRLLAHDVEVVAATYPAKVGVPRWEFSSSRPMMRHSDTGLVEIDDVGFGFVLTARSALMRLAAAFPERRLAEHSGQYATTAPPQATTYMHDFFPMGFMGDIYVSEDVGFCYSWRRIGGKIWLDPTIRLTHHGMHGYSGDPMSLIVPAMQAGEAA